MLRRIKRIADRIIVRLPRYDNHWMYLIRKDLGIFYFKDQDHKREYTVHDAISLVESSGWVVRKALNDVDIKIMVGK